MSFHERFSDTDLCVKCGLCLPHCPTYVKTLDENESPRGRLSLIQGWATGQLDASAKLLGHLDRCLLCRACEAVCPANVPYGQLVDRFRAQTGMRGKPVVVRVKSSALRSVLQNPGIAGLAASARGWLQRAGVLGFLGFGDLAAGLPEWKGHAPWPGFHAARGREIARVGLFLGCTAELADVETVVATIRLLNRLGVSVRVPRRQGCCGALALHAGKRTVVSRMAKQNRNAFDLSELDGIITLASGCGAVLKDYPLWDPSPASQSFAANLADVSQFLATLDWPEDVVIESIPAKVSVHSPCTLKNVLRAERHPIELLGRIPGLDIRSVSDAAHCCGAAGSYMLEHPGMAAVLRDDILDELLSWAPDYLVTSNVGCALHLRTGLKLRRLEHIRVMHPIVLLERAVQAS